MDISEFKKILDKIKDKKRIIFTKHATNRINQRKINIDEILKLLDTLDGLLSVELQEGSGLLGPNYILVFKKLSNYDLIVIIGINGYDLEVITCFMQEKKKRNRYLKWLNSQK